MWVEGLRHEPKGREIKKGLLDPYFYLFFHFIRLYLALPGARGLWILALKDFDPILYVHKTSIEFPFELLHTRLPLIENTLERLGIRGWHLKQVVEPIVQLFHHFEPNDDVPHQSLDLLNVSLDGVHVGWWGAVVLSSLRLFLFFILPGAHEGVKGLGVGGGAEARAQGA